MGAYYPKRPSGATERTSRGWAWEFLRRNIDYRARYAEWLALPIAVKNPKFSEYGEPFHGCPPDVAMTFFSVEIPPLENENVGDWLSRTASQRAGKACQISLSDSALPFEFGISQWTDPNCVPSEETLRELFDDMELVHYSLLDWKSPRYRKDASVTLPLGVNDLALYVDIRCPDELLIARFAKVLSAHRKQLAASGLFEVAQDAEAYDSKKVINPSGIYEEYISVLDRLAACESEESIRRRPHPDADPVDYDDGYVDKMAARIKAAKHLRDVGYKELILHDDFKVGSRALPSASKSSTG